LDFAVLGQYLRDMQIVLIVLAIGATLSLLWSREHHVRQAAFVVAGNLVVNLGFFLSHPIFTPYYVVPIAMLSLWTLSFARLLQPAEAREAASVRREPASLGALPR
jgi:4-amino-4-deoxy-L-arabinose transferase-like glycosyltransferase